MDSKLTTALGQPSRVAHMTTGPATHDTHIYGINDTVTPTNSLQRTRGASDRCMLSLDGIRIDDGKELAKFHRLRPLVLNGVDELVHREPYP